MNQIFFVNRVSFSAFPYSYLVIRDVCICFRLCSANSFFGWWDQFHRSPHLLLSKLVCVIFSKNPGSNFCISLSLFFFCISPWTRPKLASRSAWSTTERHRNRRTDGRTDERTDKRSHTDMSAHPKRWSPDKLANPFLGKKLQLKFRLCIHMNISTEINMEHKQTYVLRKLSA